MTACDEAYTGEVMGISLVGSSANESNDFMGSCGGNGFEDVVQYIPDSSGTYCINTAGSQIHTAVYVRAGICDDSTTELGCGASLDFPPNTSPADTGQRVVPANVQVDLEAGDTYFIFVDALFNNQGGDWGLTVLEGPCRGVPGDNDNGGNNGGNNGGDRDPDR